MSACDGFGDFSGTFDNAFGDISQTISDQLVGFNPLGAEAIAIGRATPIIAGNNFTSGGDHGIRLNFSYDFRLAGRQGGEIDNKPTESWLFIDHCLENAEDYLQFRLVEGGNLEGFGKGESFFVDRAGVTTQNFSVGANVTPPKSLQQLQLEAKLARARARETEARAEALEAEVQLRMISETGEEDILADAVTFNANIAGCPPPPLPFGIEINENNNDD